MVFGLPTFLHQLDITYRYGYIGDDFRASAFTDVDDKEGIMTSMPKGFPAHHHFPHDHSKTINIKAVVYSFPRKTSGAT